MCNLKWSVEAGGVLETLVCMNMNFRLFCFQGSFRAPGPETTNILLLLKLVQSRTEKAGLQGRKLWRWADRLFTSQSKASPYLSQALSSGNGVWSRAEASSLWDSFLPGFRQYKGWTLLCFPAVYIFSQIRNQRPAQITMVGTHFLFSSWGFRSLFSQSKVRLLLTLARG